MKTFTLIIFLSAISPAIMAQPVLEKILNESANICRMESTGEVYYTMDVVNKECNIYRLDHSLYKTISLPTPEGYYLSDVQYVSEKLFNSDNLVELVYSYSKYVPTTNSYYYSYETKVINENGDILVKVPGAGHTRVIEVPDAGKKFLVYEYDYSVIPFITYTHVYSLPDSTGESVRSAEFSLKIGDPFPNPASRKVSIPVDLPNGEQAGTLELFDMNGQMRMSYPVTSSDQQLIIQTRGFVPGTYVYHIVAGSIRSPAKKIIVRN